MVKKLTQFVKKAISKLKGKKIPEDHTLVEMNIFSQPHVLQQRMKEADMTHDQRVLATLSPVRLNRSHTLNGEVTTLYFCPLETVKITEHMSAGDGGEIPAEAEIKGFSVPKSTKTGLYTLKNVELHSNGAVSVKVTEKTKWEFISED